MSDEIVQKVRIESTGDSSAIKTIQRDLSKLDASLKNLKQNGAGQALNKAFEDTAKSAKKISDSFKPTKTLVEGLNKEMSQLRDTGGLTNKVLGRMATELRAVVKQAGNLKDASKEDLKVWGTKIERFKAARRAIQEIGIVQQSLLDKIAKKEDLITTKREAAQKSRKSGVKSEIELELQRQRLELSGANLQERSLYRRDVADRKANQVLKRQKAEKAREERLSNRLDWVDIGEGVRRYKAAEKDKVSAAKSRIREIFKGTRRVKLSDGEGGSYSVLSTKSFRDKMAMNTKVFRQQKREQDELIRDQERHENRMRSQMWRGASQFRQNASYAVQEGRKPALMAAGAAVAASAAAYKGIAAAMSANSAETNLKIFGLDSRDKSGKQYTPDQQSAQVADLRKGWINNESIKNGILPASTLNTYTEVLKAGIQKEIAQSITTGILQGATAIDLPVAETTKLVGSLNSGIFGKSMAQRTEILNDAMRGIAIAAMETRADSSELVASISRAGGVTAATKMTTSQLAAFNAAGISGGMMPGKAGTFADFLVNDIVGSQDLDPNRKKQLAKGLRLAGMGGLGSARQEMTENPAEFLNKLFSNTQGMDEKTRSRIAGLIGMREWRGEFLIQAKSNDVYKRALDAQKDPNNQNILEEGRQKRMNSWQGRWNATKTIFGLFWENFGLGFDKIFKDITDFFVAAGTKFDWVKVSDHVHAFTDALLKGLGFSSIADVLKKVFGDPNDLKFDWIKELTGFGKGLGSGLRSIFEPMINLLKSVSGGNVETMGNLVGKIIGLSAALVVLSPLLTVFSAVIAGFVAMASAVQALTAIGALVGGASAAGGVGAAVGGVGAVAGTAAFGVGLAALASVVATGAGLYVLVKNWDGLTGILNGAFEYIFGKSTKDPQNPGAEDPFWKRIWNWMRSSDAATEIKEQSKAIKDNTKVQKQSLDVETTGSIGGLRKLASHSTESSSGTIQALGARIQLAALGSGGSAVSGFGSGGGFGGSSSGLAGAAGGGYVGSMLGGTPGARRGNFGGGGISGSAGSGAGAGVGSMVGYGANPSAYKNALDYIARAEGTAHKEGGGYNTSLGYGKFLPGGKEQKLTEMSLDDVSNLGHYMRRQPGNPNSSALGRYQIVGQTLRGLMRDMGLKGTDKFDEATQDRMGAELIRRRGANATGLGQEWASLKGGKGAEAAAIVGQIPRGASTVPGARPADGAAGGLGNGNVAEGIAQLRKSGAISGTECVDLVKAWTGTKGITTKQWRKGDAASAGTLKPGDSVATFLDSNFNPSNQYAGGTGGNAGANKDHAAVFQEYIKDASGQNIGMKVLEQYNKTRGQQVPKDYMFGQGGRGESNGSNYNKVLGPDGVALGGERAPTAQALAKGAADSPIARMGDSMMGRGNGGGGGQSNSAAITAPINIYHHGDSEQMGHKVQRHLQESRNWRTSDQSFSGA